VCAGISVLWCDCASDLSVKLCGEILSLHYQELQQRSVVSIAEGQGTGRSEVEETQGSTVKEAAQD
jgi:hypothetical protein